MTEEQKNCTHEDIFEWQANSQSGCGAPADRKMVSCKKCNLLLTNHPELIKAYSKEQ